MLNNISNKLILILSLCSVLVFQSCQKDYETIQEIDEAKIQAYLRKNNITAEKDPSGFYYQILDKGNGASINNPDSVFYSTEVKSTEGVTYFKTNDYGMVANYLGYVTPTPYRIVLSQLNRGGKARVILPSYLAYGKNGSDPVPPNEIIVTDINLFPESNLNAIDDRFIQQFITDKALTGFTKLPSRVYRNITTLGTGTPVRVNDVLKVKYTGRILNGIVFDQSGDKDLEQPLYQLIKGWRLGLSGLPVGSKVRLLVPSDLGYGAAVYGAVPANSNLDFDIEIVSIVE